VRPRLSVTLILVIAVVAAVSTLVTPAGATSTPPDAPAGSASAYQLNAAHDGHSTDHLALPLARLWSRDFGARVSYPVMVSGRAFVTTATVGGAHGSDLWALRARDGAALWGPISLGGTYYLSMLTADSANVYALNDAGDLSAFDQATGTPIWHVRLGGQWMFTSPPTVHGGVVYTAGAGSGGTLYAVDAATGALQWTAAVSNGDHSSPAVTDDGVYVSYACEVTYRFNPAGGARQWIHTTGCSGGGGRTPVVHGDRVYVRDDAGQSPVILSTADGTATGAFSSTTAPAFSDDRMFTVAAGTMRAIDVATGTVEWSQAGDGNLVTAPLVVGSAVIAASSSGKVFLFDTTTGALLWSGETESAIQPPDEHNVQPLVGLAESGGVLLVPASNQLVAYAPDQLSLSHANVSFAAQRVGTASAARVVTITNAAPAAAALTVHVTGAGASEFRQTNDCGISLPAGMSCHVRLTFDPTTIGTSSAALVVDSDAPGSPDVANLRGIGTDGYFLADTRGDIRAFGDAVFRGDLRNVRLNAPALSVETTPSGNGYWLLARDGGVFAFGDAHFYGSTGALRLAQPIVGMARTPRGRGYWLVAADGGVFAFGDARFYGSTAALKLRRPVVGIAPTHDGRGYWLTAEDGGVFAFGNARYYGSPPASATRRVRALEPTPSAQGYWVLTSDGHVYAYGDAHNFGSATGHTTVGIASTHDGRGYWVVDAAGDVHAYGDAHDYGGGMGGNTVVAVAPSAPPS
jgi:outer membrane protein assembly factor BamB